MITSKQEPLPRVLRENVYMNSLMLSRHLNCFFIVLFLFCESFERVFFDRRVSNCSCSSLLYVSTFQALFNQ